MAFPMLTGTLVTISGFLPIGLAKSSVGQYTFSLFAVIGVALTFMVRRGDVLAGHRHHRPALRTIKAKHAGPGG